MKKILHLIVGLETGGTEMMLLKTLPYLKGEHHIVCSITTMGPVGALLSDAGVSVVTLGAKKGFSLQTFMQILRLVKQEKPDILQTYLLHADLLGRFAAALAGVPITICSIRAKLHELRFLPFVFIDVITSVFVDKYLANSETSKRWFSQKGVSSKKISVIYNGIDLNQFAKAENRNQTRTIFGGDASTIIIGCVAKFRAQKGHTYLIRAFSEFVKHFPNSKLALIGDGPTKAVSQHLVSRLGIGESVVFLGDRSDIPSLLYGIDIFAMATLYEGMSNSIMEAMAAGLPIITTDISENRELITHARHGLLVKVKDSRELANAMTIFANDSAYATQMGIHARERIRTAFTIDTTRDKLNALYAELATI